MFRKYKNIILEISLKKIYQKFFLNDYKNTGYYFYLKKLYFNFLKTKYPRFDYSEFDKNINLLLNYDGIDTLDVYYSAFDPDFRIDLNGYYKLHEKQIFLRFLKYSLNTKLIKNKYSEIYNYCIQLIDEPLKILEIGGGVPHGLIYNNWKAEKNICDKLTYVEADMLHAEFVKWYCKTNSINLEMKLFPASKTPTINGLDFNFVFAKDIFEHLDNPKKLVEELVYNTKNKKTLLCLDLEHKGEITIQHISPNLTTLKKILTENGFEVIKKYGDINIWRKN